MGGRDEREAARLWAEIQRLWVELSTLRDTDWATPEYQSLVRAIRTSVDAYEALRRFPHD